MESIYAALLLHKASKKITEAAIEKVLTAAGVEPDKSQISKLITGLKEKNIDEIIASATATPVMATSVSGGAKPAKEAPKKEKKEEEETEAEPTGKIQRIPLIAGIGSLF